MINLTASKEEEVYELEPLTNESCQIVIREEDHGEEDEDGSDPECLGCRCRSRRARNGRCKRKKEKKAKKAKKEKDCGGELQC